MAAPREGDLLWTPPPGFAERSRLGRFLAAIERRRGARFDSYEAAWRWSVDDLEGFWSALWEHFEVAGERGARALGRREMPGAEWFPGARLSYVEHLFRQATPERPALLAAAEDRPLVAVTWAELEREVAAVAAGLARLGVGAGDRVAAYLPNGVEAVVGFLATAALGAVWTCAPPEFGAKSVVDRFRLVEPRVLLAADGAVYGGRRHDRRGEVEAVRAALPELAATFVVPRLGLERPAGTRPWSELAARAGAPLAARRVPFDHPLWILYSSGTTGPPKAIVHGAGGILLEHLKSNALHLDLGPGDVFFWYTTTGWMMWNKLVSGLLAGATVLLYDGSPGHPDLAALWRLAATAGVTYFGASAAFLEACRRAGLAPARGADLARLRALGSTGSPLSPAGFAWVYEAVGRDLWLQSVSGGTDVCTAFLGGAPSKPVRAGELQARALGARVEAFDERGRSVVGEVGELVVTAPMPSMPLRFWNDPDGARYRESYFDRYPGVWRHGDWIRITPEGGAVIYGRSDATLNRHGVRLGSSEIYAVVEAIPGVADSLVVDVELAGRPAWMGLFVALAAGAALDAALADRIRSDLRHELSPRHVPDAIVAVDAIPKTLNGKKLELPVKKVLAGTPPERAATPGSLADPAALAAFVPLGEKLRRGEL